MSDKQITKMLLVLVLIYFIVPVGSISFLALFWGMVLILASWAAYKVLTTEKVVNLLRVSWNFIILLIKAILILWAVSLVIPTVADIPATPGKPTCVMYTPFISNIICLLI